MGRTSAIFLPYYMPTMPFVHPFLMAIKNIKCRLLVQHLLLTATPHLHPLALINVILPLGLISCANTVIVVAILLKLATNCMAILLIILVIKLTWSTKILALNHLGF